MTILDTDFLVALLKGDLAVVEKADLIPSPGTTVINAFELYYGAKRAMNDTALEEVKSLLQSLDLFSLDDDAAMKAGEIQGALAKGGRPINVSDVLIAGIVLTRNEELLTRNADHFSKIPGLRWRSW